MGLGIVSAGGAAAAGEEAALATRGGVYSLRDEIGQVVRTGRTKDFEARQNQHALDPSTTAFRFRREYATDDYAEQRGLEQVLYEGHPEAHFSNGGLNKIRGISPTNPRRAEYEEAARTYLARMR